MITLAARAAKPKSKVAKVKSKVSTKSVKKIAAGRKGGKATATKTTKTKKAAPKESYYWRNRAAILAATKKYYKKNRMHIQLRVKAWRRKCTKKVGGVKIIVPFYAQGKPNGKKPIHPRGPRLNGPAADKGRDLTTGKKPATTMSARRIVEKKEAKYDRSNEKARSGAKPGPKRRMKPGPKPKAKVAKRRIMR